MRLYVLVTRKPVPFSREEHKHFYFKTKEDADKFLYVFKDHWCHVDFVGEYRDVILSELEREQMEKDPTTRAEDNLSWGFHFADYYNDGGLREEEKAFVEEMAQLWK